MRWTIKSLTQFNHLYHKSIVIIEKRLWLHMLQIEDNIFVLMLHTSITNPACFSYIEPFSRE